jgi:cytochrome P450
MGTGPQSPGGGPARAGVLDLLHLGAALGADLLRGKQSDPAAAGRRWADEVMQRDGGADVDIVIPGLPLELVGNRAHSDRVLSSAPDADGYHAGHTKTIAMQFLAPGALTIANGAAWRKLRPFNERVLGTGSPHPFAQTFLDDVRSAFSKTVASEGDVRAAMGRAMVKIVLGDVNPALDPAGDVTKLFGVVQSPVKRTLLGFLYRRRRERLYGLLRRKWDNAAERPYEETLVALASREATDADRETLLQQIPHWMFTFTGSGTDLLARTLCMITSRPAAHARAVREIRDAAPLDRAASLERLPFIEACLLETGRLFPPVTRTFHQHSGGSARDRQEVVHYFPLLQRDDRLGPTVHQFRPERWLEPTLDEAAAASNLFLRGPRQCPGMDLILFVCKAALARQIGELRVTARQERLTYDPLPISFPKIDAEFAVGGVTP